MKSLLRKKVGIDDSYFLQFFYPHFRIVSELSSNEDYSSGVIYKGLVTDDILEFLEVNTKGQYIIVSKFPDVTLETPSDFVKVFFPLLEEKATRYDLYPLRDFLSLVKTQYILSKNPVLYKATDHNIYQLFSLTLGSKKALYEYYFQLLDAMGPRLLAASILTFLNKVQKKEYSGLNRDYIARLNTAYLRYGDKIKPAVYQFATTEKNLDLALWTLLDTLSGSNYG